MNKRQAKYNTKELYNKDGVRIVMYQHNNGTKTLRAFYKGKPENLQRNFYNAIARLNKSHPILEPNERLEDYLSRTEDVKYVDNLGSINGGLILGAYIPLQDTFYLRKDIPRGLVKVVEQYLKNQGKRTSNIEGKIRKFRNKHEAAHRRRQYTGETQNEQDVDLESAVLSGEYPLIRFPSVLRAMNDPRIREQILNKPGTEYVQRVA